MRAGIIVIILLAVVTALTAVYLRTRGGGPAVTVSADGRSVDFSSMEAFLTSEFGRRPQRHQVVFIGLDGASWNIIDPMIEEGLLPTFARLKGEGAYGDLRSVDCYFSPPAWAAMMTGYLPHKTGIYTFGKWDPDDQLFHSISSLDIKVPSVWDVASAAGRRVAVTNVPVTHPVHPVDGIMVSGLMTPFSYERNERTLNARFSELKTPFDERLDGKSFAPRLVGASVLSVTTFAIVLYDTTDDGRTNYDTVALKLFPTGGEWELSDDVPVRTFPPNEYSPWFKIRYRKGGEKREMKDVSCSVKLTFGGSSGRRGRLSVSPLLRSPADPEMRMTYPDSLGREIDDTFGYYLISMAFEPEMIPACTNYAAQFASFFYNYDDWDLFFYVFMAPDNIHHVEGASERAKLVYQNIDRYLARLLEEMPDDATLVLASDHGFAKYKYIIDFNQFLTGRRLYRARGNGDPDYDRSLVFHDQWCLYFNDKMLTSDVLKSRGVPIEPGEPPREALIRYLKTEARKIRETKSRRLLPVELIEVPQDGAGHPPDMVVIGAYTDYFVEGADIRIRTTTTVREASKRSEWYHRRDGMYLLWGNKIQGGAHGTRNIEDIAPTILYLLGVPLARDFDGRVMDPAIRGDVLARNQRFYLERYADLTPVYADSYEELQTLEEKLRALGYVR